MWRELWIFGSCELTYEYVQSTSTYLFDSVVQLYLQARLPIHRLRALRLALQTVAIAGAFYCGLSRVSDNKHHPTDVLAGAILGVLAALFTVCFSLSYCLFVAYL